MGGIICAIRGGTASQSTIRRAIELAKSEQRPLTFLYVVNLDFLTYTMKSRITSIEEDMRQMGELILLMASDSAAAQQINAENVVREGEVAEEITALCRELDADYVIVGEPLLKEETAVFTSEKIKALADKLKNRCRAQLIVVA